MKMIRAIVRPEAADDVAETLSEAGFTSLTKIPVFGRGRQKGITVGAIRYDELAKVLLLIVVNDESEAEVVKRIKYKTHTGNFGDGKIFITAVDAAFTMRTGAEGL